jgi:hypothetical protein
MFQTQDNSQTTGGDLGATAKGVLGTYKDIQDAIKEYGTTLGDNVIKQFEDIQGKAATLNKTLLNGISGYDRGISQVLTKTLNKTLQIGGTIQDATDAYSTINTELGKSVILNEDILTKTIEFSKATGLSVAESAKLVANFMDLGLSIAQSQKESEKLRQTAAKFGINAGQFIKTIGENIKTAAAYGFRNGIDGLSKMVARSQALRVEFKGITGLADRLFDPEKAIELAANMQVLGGAVGDLADPFKLMYMAENDVEGLQEAIGQAAAASVTFNEQTGDFKLTGTEMRRLRAQADALGMDYNDLVDKSIKYRRESEILSRLQPLQGFSNLSKEQQQVIASLAEIGPGGKVDLRLPGFEQGVTNFAALFQKGTDEQIALAEFQASQQKSDRDIAQEQLAISTKNEINVRTIRDAVVIMAAEGRGSKVGDFLTKIEDYTKQIGEFVDDNYEKVAKIGSSLSNAALNAAKVGAEGAIAASEQAVRTATAIQGGDVYLPKNMEKAVVSPAGTFSLREDDELIAGTNLGLNELGYQNDPFQLLSKQLEVQTNEIKNASVSPLLLDSTKNIQVQMDNLNIQHSVNGSIAITGLPTTSRISRDLFEDSDFIVALKNKIQQELEDSLKKQLV